MRMISGSVLTLVAAGSLVFGAGTAAAAPEFSQETAPPVSLVEQIQGVISGLLGFPVVEPATEIAVTELPEGITPGGCIDLTVWEE